ncbi:MAG: PEGA domain-containing protein [Deltaproteobacteria bacterium]|nr:PEGA domain-containing protein [Deltaproteobacteria bacterium]
MFSLNVAGMEQTYAQVAIDALATAIAESKTHRVISKTELEAMLGAEKIKEAVGCTDVTCLAEIGAAAGASRIVSGSVARAGKSLLVNLQLVNTEYASVENRVSLAYDGELGELPALLGVAADELVLPLKQRKPGTVRIAGVPNGAVISLDEKNAGVGPSEIGQVKQGVHTLRVDASGYEPFKRAFLMRSGGSVSLDVSLSEKKGTPFYATWWFWTVTGVVVAGAVTTGVVLGTRPVAPKDQGTSVDIAFPPSVVGR